MLETRYFEKSSGGVVRHWQIGRVGIRCHVAWGQEGGKTRGSSTTRDDEADAERYFNEKIAEKIRQGYVEVAPSPAVEAAKAAAGTAADAMADAKLLEVMREQEERRYKGAWDFYWEGHEPVEGYEGVFAKCHRYQSGPGPFHQYLVLSEDERRGLYFIVKEPGHDPENVSAFLDFVRPRLELAFDGRSHHKVALPTPIGQFDHVLFCAPSLSGYRYGGRLGRAFPILDCEIGDEDTETLVEARLEGRDAMPWTTWDREPFPVIDLKFDLRSRDGFAELGGKRSSVRNEKFKVYPRSALEWTLRLLSEAVPGSRLEIRNYRNALLTLARADLSPETPTEVDRFLLGDFVQGVMR